MPWIIDPIRLFDEISTAEYPNPYTYGDYYLGEHHTSAGTLHRVMMFVMNRWTIFEIMPSDFHAYKLRKRRPGLSLLLVEVFPRMASATLIPFAGTRAV